MGELHEHRLLPNWAGEREHVLIHLRQDLATCKQQLASYQAALADIPTNVGRIWGLLLPLPTKPWLRTEIAKNILSDLRVAAGGGGVTNQDVRASFCEHHDTFETAWGCPGCLLDTNLTLEGKLATIQAQLPQGMEHCTIQFYECSNGHGRLIATNWIDPGCLVCQLARWRTILQDLLANRLR